MQAGNTQIVSAFKVSTGFVAGNRKFDTAQGDEANGFIPGFGGLDLIGIQTKITMGSATIIFIEIEFQDLDDALVRYPFACPGGALGWQYTNGGNVRRLVEWPLDVAGTQKMPIALPILGKFRIGVTPDAVGTQPNVDVKVLIRDPLYGH